MTATGHVTPDETYLLPTSFVQRGVWDVARLAPRHPVLAVPEALRLRGRLDRTALRRALDELVRRHESLRSTFREADGELVAQVHAHAEVELERAGPLPDPDGPLAEAPAPPELTHAPLLRVRLFELGPDDHVVLVVSHLMVYDAASRDVLTRELGLLYRAYALGTDPALPPLPLQYADVANWQNDSIASGAYSGQLHHWRRVLAGLARPSLPGSPGEDRFAAQVHRGRLDEPLLAAATESGKNADASLFMVLLSVYHALLAGIGGRADFAIGTPVLCRDRPEFQGIVGRFVNHVAIRAESTSDTPFATLLSRVRRASLDAFAHRDLPLEYLQAQLLPGTASTDDPWFRATFVLHSAAAGELTLPGLTIARHPVSRGAARYDLELHVWPAGDGAEVQLLRRTGVLSAATGDRLAAGFAEAVRAAVADPARPAGELGSRFAPRKDNDR
ncbi:condensation domain-containing protein [Amycolatopsis sp., V23-08]|uniref:Condensation domain-containing protein n=1 Tax=Amycolatopsis heterodermiae TaxID=3110235 RepID=A0ABU5R2B6_9PSEU|nr:condensation domain-containing protein [Amycolatopsis sp., V23-08]MEA5360347.1 condensation domain-containing protein [Amycolatopsis sp., V23-08]